MVVGNPVLGSKVAAFDVRRIVEEIPHVEEVVVRHAATDAFVQVKEASEFAAKLDGVRTDHFGGYVLVAVGPLIQDAADIGAKVFEINAANVIDRS